MDSGILAAMEELNTIVKVLNSHQTNVVVARVLTATLKSLALDLQHHCKWFAINILTYIHTYFICHVGQWKKAAKELMWTYKLKSIYKKVTNNINKPMNYLQWVRKNNVICTSLFLICYRLFVYIVEHSECDLQHCHKSIFLLIYLLSLQIVIQAHSVSWSILTLVIFKFKKDSLCIFSSLYFATFLLFQITLYLL